jgi:hypothetical protein
MLDERRYEELADIFATDGVWHRQGRELEGRRMIIETMAERSESLAIRHVLTNVDVSPREDGTIEVFGYVLVFRSSGDAREAGPLAMPSAPSTLQSIRDTYKLVGDSWKILRKEARSVFTTPGGGH